MYYDVSDYDYITPVQLWSERRHRHQRSISCQKLLIEHTLVELQWWSDCSQSEGTGPKEVLNTGTKEI